MAGKIYDGRPSTEDLAARMRRDRVEGHPRAIVSESESIYGANTYSVVTMGVFDDAGEMVAHYQTRRDGRVKGAKKGQPSFNWMVPQPGQYRFASAEDLAALDGQPDAGLGEDPAQPTPGGP